jgi:hypothetical protein
VQPLEGRSDVGRCAWCVEGGRSVGLTLLGEGKVSVYTLKVYGLSGRTAPLILNLCTIRRLGESQTRSGRFGHAGDRPRITQPVA